MKTKSKPCKGTGKAINYGCGSLELVHKYGLGISCGCYSKWLLNTPEGQEKINKAKLQGKKRLSQEQAKKDRQFKLENKSIAKLIQEARKPFQEWIRLRDINLACISCNNLTAELWDAGHYYKAELYTGLIFDEMNVNKQCKYCNMVLSGNESGYRIGLIKKYGQKAVEELDQRAKENRTKKYTRDELIEIKKYYKLKLKEDGKNL